MANLLTRQLQKLVDLVKPPLEMSHIEHSPDLLNDYRDGQLQLLNRLQDNIEEACDRHGRRRFDPCSLSLNKKDLVLLECDSDLVSHSELLTILSWKSRRVWTTAIRPFGGEKGERQSSHDRLEALIKLTNMELRQRKIGFLARRRIIRQAKKDLEMLRKRHVALFLADAKRQACELLLGALQPIAAASNNSQDVEDLIRRIQALSNKKRTDVVYVWQALRVHREIKRCYRKALKLRKKYLLSSTDGEEFTHIARQFRVLSLRWNDINYVRGRYSKFGQAWYLFRIVSVVLGAVFLSLFLLSFWFPPGFFLSAPAVTFHVAFLNTSIHLFQFLANIGFWPVVNLVIENIRDVIYGRSPMMMRLLMMFVAPAVIALLKLVVGPILIPNAAKILANDVPWFRYLLERFNELLNVERFKEVATVLKSGLVGSVIAAKVYFTYLFASIYHQKMFQKDRPVGPGNRQDLLPLAKEQVDQRQDSYRLMSRSLGQGEDQTNCSDPVDDDMKKLGDNTVGRRLGSDNTEDQLRHRDVGHSLDTQAASVYPGFN